MLNGRNGEQLPEETTADDLWTAKYRCDSAFHPDTNEKMFVMGRMSCQVPMNMVNSGMMMTFYKYGLAWLPWLFCLHCF